MLKFKLGCYTEPISGPSLMLILLSAAYKRARPSPIAGRDDLCPVAGADGLPPAAGVGDLRPAAGVGDLRSALRGADSPMTLV